MEQFLTYNIAGFNWVDAIFVFIIFYFILTSRGFIETILDVVGFIFSLAAAYKLYTFVGGLLLTYFHFTRGIANAFGFFISWFLFETVLFTIIYILIIRLLGNVRLHPINRYLGKVAGALHGFVIFLFLVSLVFSFPTRGQIKQSILDSRTGPFFVNLSQTFEKSIKNVFGGAISESINFLTVKPDSNSTLDLGFKLKDSQLSPDEASEIVMFNLINTERKKLGFKTLTFDYELRPVARTYGRQMMTNGFFAHTSAIDGTSPGDRATNAGVEYSVLGENLAFAPDVYIAHQGLMNSPGHRANILSPDYSRVGIGVIDGGVYGKIFVQEFRN